MLWNMNLNRTSGLEGSVVYNWKINQLQVSGQGILSNEGMENRGQERVGCCVEIIERGVL